MVVKTPKREWCSLVKGRSKHLWGTIQWLEWHIQISEVERFLYFLSFDLVPSLLFMEFQFPAQPFWPWNWETYHPYVNFSPCIYFLVFNDRNFSPCAFIIDYLLFVCLLVPMVHVMCTLVHPIAKAFLIYIHFLPSKKKKDHYHPLFQIWGFCLQHPLIYSLPVHSLKRTSSPPTRNPSLLQTLFGSLESHL